MSGWCMMGLKEWAVLVDALASGDQLILLRKGGIEDVGGEFRLESESFVLWPTWLHQSPDWLRPEQIPRLKRLEAARDGEDVRLSLHAQVYAICEVPNRAALDGLESEHLWSPAYLDLRWQYRPELPLYLLLLRCSKLAAPVTVRETPAQRGCRSWVKLNEPVELAGARPVLDEAEFTRRAEALRAALR